MWKRTRIRITRRWLFWALLAYGALGFIPMIWSENDALMLAFVLGEIAIGLAHLCLPRKYDEEARTDADGLWIGARLVVPRKSIRGAHLRTRRGKAWLRLQRSSGWADVALDTPSEARAWLSALRLDAAGLVWRQMANADRLESRAARARLVFLFILPITGMVATLASLGALLAAHARYAIWTTLSGMGLLFALQIAAMCRDVESVAIGTDGLTLRRWIGRTRFVPFASVADVRAEGRDIILTLRDGREIAWHVSRLAFSSLLARHRAFFDRIVEGLAAHRALVANESAAQLARGARSISAWLRDLRVVAEPDRAGYRVAALPPDALWKTIENATAPPTARAGAAVALEATLDEPARKRLREVAATCASNDLRAALEAAAADTDVEARLERLAD